MQKKVKKASMFVGASTVVHWQAQKQNSLKFNHLLTQEWLTVKCSKYSAIAL